MNILVIEEVAGELSALGEPIRRSGHAVRFTDAGAALEVIEAERPDITVAVCREAASALAPIVKALRAFDDAAFRSLIAVVRADTKEARSAAYEEGADDVALVTASPEEIADHVRSAERIVRLERRLRERVVELESALRRLALGAVVRGQSLAPAGDIPNRGGLRFLLTHAWTQVDEILLSMCSDYLQHPYAQVIGAGPIPKDCVGATISLTDVENELVFELTFFVPPETARTVATMFTGDADLVDDDVTRDVLLELANSGMGAVRAAFLREEFRFAASTPKALSGPSDPRRKGYEAQRVLAFRHGDAVVHVVAIVRHHGRIKVRGAQLREGMVVACDISNPAGLLLVRAGTRLTETSAEKIARLLPKSEIELADAA